MENGPGCAGDLRAVLDLPAEAGEPERSALKAAAKDGSGRLSCEAVLEPGGCTAFRSDPSSNMPTHPAQQPSCAKGLQLPAHCQCVRVLYMH